MFKKFKKFAAVLLAFTMIMGLAMTASAKTIVSTNQDTSVMTITSTTTAVSYDATTVEGGTEYPDVTRYSYYLMVPAGGSISSVPVSVTVGSGYRVYVDGATTPLATPDKPFNGTLDFSNGTKTFVAVNSDGDTREFKVTAGVNGTDLQTVYVRVDVKNAVEWAGKPANVGTAKANAVNDKVAAIKAAVSKVCPINDSGIMTAYVPVNLKAGATAMDALEAACDTLHLEIQGSSTYVEAIGTSTLKLGQFDTDGMSGWMYLNKTSANGAFEAANYGAASYNLAGGEYFAWVFVNTWGGGQTDYLNK